MTKEERDGERERERESRKRGRERKREICTYAKSERVSERELESTLQAIVLRAQQCGAARAMQSRLSQLPKHVFLAPNAKQAFVADP